MLTNRISATTTRRSAVMAGLAASWLATVSGRAAQEASPATDVTADMIRELEHARLQSLVEFDLDAAMALHADDFQLINPAGVALTREDYLGSLGAGFVDYLIFEPAEEIVVYLSSGSAILRYMSNLEVVVDGTLVPERNYWHTDYYEERDGHWQTVLSHATEILA